MQSPSNAGFIDLVDVAETYSGPLQTARQRAHHASSDAALAVALAEKADLERQLQVSTLDMFMSSAPASVRMWCLQQLASAVWLAELFSRFACLMTKKGKQRAYAFQPHLSSPCVEQPNHASYIEHLQHHTTLKQADNALQKLAASFGPAENLLHLVCTHHVKQAVSLVPQSHLLPSLPSTACADVHANNRLYHAFSIVC